MMPSQNTSNINNLQTASSRYYELLSLVSFPKIALLVALAIAANCFYNVFLHPLRKIPGPFLAGVTELWRTTRYGRGQWHDDILDLHRQYGPVVRVSPNEVSFVDREALEQVYGHSTGTKKTWWYDTWKVRGSGAGIFNEIDPKAHAFLRKRVAVAYSKTTIVSQDDRVQDVLDLVWDRFRQFAQEGQEIDMQLWADYFAFDTVGQLGIGRKIGFIEGGDTMGLLSWIHQFFYVSSVFGYLPSQMLFLQWPAVHAVIKLFGGPTGINAFGTWNVEQILRRKNEILDDKRHEKDMLDHFIAMKEVDGRDAELPSIMNETGTLIGAGADTAAIGIATTIAQLMAHPDDLARLRREVDAAYARLGASDKGDVGALSESEAAKIPFLQACVKEATRLCPSIVWQLPREAPEGGITIAGYYIPPSATLSISARAHNRCKQIFGDDADEWRPQRWLAGPDELGQGEKPEEVKKMERYNTTFGYGPRVCIGRHLAMMEMLKFVGQLVRQFDLEPLNKAKPFQRRSQWWCVHEDFWVRLQRRE